MSFTENQRPLIGITIDYQESKSYSSFPWYALRTNYGQVILKSGGIPVLLVPDIGLVKDYLSLIHGLLVTGGAFDVDPSLYGEKDVHSEVNLNATRTDFEYGIVESSLEKDLPIFGVCGGEQLLNVVLGGDLIQHIPDSFPDSLPHEQSNPRDEASHSVQIKPDTLIHQIVEATEMHVNSAHHQAISTVPDEVTINAVSPDGVIEGIEDSRYNFCLGVQWHPEFEIDQGDAKLFKAFVKAAALYAKENTK